MMADVHEVVQASGGPGDLSGRVEVDWFDPDGYVYLEAYDYTGEGGGKSNPIAACVTLTPGECRVLANFLLEAAMRCAE